MQGDTESSALLRPRPKWGVRVGRFALRGSSVSYTGTMKAILFDANGVLYHRSGQHAYLRAFLRQQHRTVPSADEIWRIRDDIRQQLPQATRRERQAALLAAVGVATWLRWV